MSGAQPTAYDNPQLAGLLGEALEGLQHFSAQLALFAFSFCPPLAPAPSSRRCGHALLTAVASSFPRSHSKTSGSLAPAQASDKPQREADEASCVSSLWQLPRASCTAYWQCCNRQRNPGGPLHSAEEPVIQWARRLQAGVQWVPPPRRRFPKASPGQQATRRWSAGSAMHHLVRSENVHCPSSAGASAASAPSYCESSGPRHREASIALWPCWAPPGLDSAWAVEGCCAVR
mmetsp:Transcript_114973/g.199330  ORF Transcript_114973/g.199330 Transcript_114973/m.199330 type:complete len:232 (-) Transcript_114973:297-992(-)